MLQSICCYLEVVGRARPTNLRVYRKSQANRAADAGQRRGANSAATGRRAARLRQPVGGTTIDGRVSPARLALGCLGYESEPTCLAFEFHGHDGSAAGPPAH